MQFNGMKKSSLSNNGSSLKETPLPKKDSPPSSVNMPVETAHDGNAASQDASKDANIEKNTAMNNAPQNQTSVPTAGNASFFQAIGHADPAMDKKENAVFKTVDFKKVKKILIPVVVALVVIIAAIIIVPKVADSIQMKKEDQQRNDAITLCLEEADSLASSENYADAVKRIRDGLSQYADSDELSKKLDEYSTLLSEQKNQQAKEAAVKSVEDKAATGDYEAAIELLDSTVKKYGSDTALDSLRADYIDKFSSSVLEEAQALVDQKDYTKAKNILADAQKLVSGNTEINTLKEYVDQYKVTTLDKLSSINGGFNWNNGTPEDPFGTNYADVSNFFVYHGDSNYHKYTYSISSEYKLSGKYDTLSLQISPYKDFGENADSDVQIYADNVLVYTSPKITQKSGVIKVVLDIYNAEYLKIVINKGDNGCLMLSDVLVSKSPEYENTKDFSLVSLATLTPLNGGFSWDGYYPEDPYGNSYSSARNYFIYHGDSGYHKYSYSTYAEYRLSGEYSELSLTIAPHSDYGVNGASYVQIYVDNVIKYTSPLITAKGGTYDTTVDLTGADYLKIVINKGDNGCIMLSDVILKKSDNPGVAANTSVDCLSTLSPLNGGFNWNNDFPQNIKKDSYQLSRNYFIYHGDSGYHKYSYTTQAEYFTNGQYNTFSMDYAPYSDFGQNGNTTITIYADDKEIFSGSITQKSVKASTGDLNISGVSYLKIVITKGDNACVIISDAILKK